MFNIERHLVRLSGGERSTPIALGLLGTAWPQVASATSADEVRRLLSRSAWGDPGGTEPTSVSFGLRVAWARRVARFAPGAGEWAYGALASLIAGEQFVFDREISIVTARELDRLLGPGWRPATSIPDLAERLADSARWSLADITSPADLWRSEVAVVRRIAHDARPIAISGRHAERTIVAILALFLVDLWRVTAAIEAAGRGPTALEVVDAVA